MSVLLADIPKQVPVGLLLLFVFNSLTQIATSDQMLVEWFLSHHWLLYDSLDTGVNIPTKTLVAMWAPQMLILVAHIKF